MRDEPSVTENTLSDWQLGYNQGYAQAREDTRAEIALEIIKVVMNSDRS